MLSSTLQSMLDNRLRYLPEITGKAIASVDWPSRIIEIGRKYGLHMDDIEELQEVVLKSMIGLASPADFENNLISATAASPATINAMVADMNEKVFEPIHDFVINNGKEENPLVAHGIEIETEPITESSHRTPSSLAEPRDTPPLSRGRPTLDIPVSPESNTPKPQVPGSFDAFFMKTPTVTDHSMVK